MSKLGVGKNGLEKQTNKQNHYVSIDIYVRKYVYNPWKQGNKMDSEGMPFHIEFWRKDGLSTPKQGVGRY